MKRASYKAAIAWIAARDTGPAEAWSADFLASHPEDALSPTGRCAVELVAELFGLTVLRVAEDVARKELTA